MKGFVDQLQKLAALADTFAARDPKKAARNLRNAAVFIQPNSENKKVYPIYWLMHVHAGGDFSDNKRSNLNLKRLRPALQSAGFFEHSPSGTKFSGLWQDLVASCTSLNTRPSGRHGKPDWSDRRIFALSDMPVGYPDEIPKSATYPEGAKKIVIVNGYERNTAARRECINHFADRNGKIDCQVCGLNFGEVYGEDIGHGFIHVHHLVELSKIDGEYEVDPRNDLVPLCPNCHSMIHKLPEDANKVTDLKKRLNLKN